MTDEEIVETLRTRREGSTATELAELLDGLTGGGLSQGALVTYFSRAFPSIPLRTLLDAGAWHRLSDGAVSDAQFNEMLGPWIA